MEEALKLEIRIFRTASFFLSIETECIIIKSNIYGCPELFCKKNSKSRNEAIINAYQSGGYSLKEVGEYFGLHYSTVSGIVNDHKSKT